MARITKGILGGFRGKVGTVVGSSIFGIDVMRAYQPDVRNPRTESQTTQRQKFSLMVDFIRRGLYIYRVGFSLAAVKMSAYNYAFSCNFFNAITGTFPNFTIDPTKIKVSQGHLPGTLGAYLEAVDLNELSITKDDNSDVFGASADDIFNVLVVNSTTGKILPVVNAGTRSQTEVFINGIGGDVGDVFTAYWFYSKADGTAISDQAFESKTLT